MIVRLVEVYGSQRETWVIAVNEIRFTPVAFYHVEGKTDEIERGFFAVHSSLYFEPTRYENFNFISH